MKPWSPFRSIRLADEDGIPSFSYTQEKEVAQRHFGKLLNGTLTSMAELIDDRRDKAQMHAEAHKEVARTVGAIPSMHFLQTENATIKTGKALPDSCIGSEVHKLCPKAMAKAYHPVHTKSALQIEIGVQWTGGCLGNLYKGRGSAAVIDNHRDVTIACTDGKQHASFLRQNLLKPIGSMVGENQHGAGFNGASCDVAHLIITEALAFAMTKNKSACIAFIDVVAAFASLRRSLVIPSDDDTNEAWKKQLVEAGFSVDEATEVINMACNMLKRQATGAHDHFIQQLIESHEATWFSTEGLALITKFAGGVAAGTPSGRHCFLRGYCFDRISSQKETDR